MHICNHSIQQGYILGLVTYLDLSLSFLVVKAKKGKQIHLKVRDHKCKLVSVSLGCNAMVIFKNLPGSTW
jgi:hypothetical protein